MTGLRIHDDAGTDLLGIYHRGVEMFGSAQADRYIEALLDTLDLIAEFPDMARVRHEIDPPARVHTHQSHVIIYDIDDRDGCVVIVRIRRVLEDWRSLSGKAEP